jgi:putative flippase GtrA
MKKMKKEQILRLLHPRSFGRFAVVGCLNTLVGIGSFPALYWALSDLLGVSALLVLAWIVSTSFAFISHKIVTFKSGGDYRHEGMKFLILSLVALGISLAVMNVVTRLTHAHPALVQLATSVGLAAALMILNYVGMSRLIFRSPPSKAIKG